MEEIVEQLKGIVAVFSALFGACFGSFLSVCIWRIPREESIVFPRSHCPSCNQLIPWYQNIPVISWIILRGKCANCKVRISPRYLFLELLTATLFWLVSRQYFDPLDGRSFLMVFLLWVVVFGLELGTFIDLDWYILPDRVTIGGMILGVVSSYFLPELHGYGEGEWVASLIESGIGLGVGFGILYLISVVGRVIYKKDAMGFGDVKLMGAVGAFWGWEAVLFTLFVSSFLGSLAGMGLCLFKKCELKGKIPYGPFIAIAAVVWLFCGEEICGWYFRVLSMRGG